MGRRIYGTPNEPVEGLGGEEFRASGKESKLFIMKELTAIRF
jgi:hypothetical protein